jgi:dihydroorotase/N-acyl-D-amino-acid deacylase
MRSLLLLKNGTLIDGTGSPERKADVMISGDRIAEVSQINPPDTCRVIDCAGLTVAPGFIDGHSHSDIQVLENRPEKVAQGVTGEVVGNCGFSAYPCSADPEASRQYANGIFRGGDSWGWHSAADYLAAVTKQARFAAVASLVGHGSLRVALFGHGQRTLSAAEMDKMEQTLSDALTQGATGFSTGLMYAPGSGAPFDELLRLCRVVARHGRIYTTHMRSYAGGLLQAIDEQIELARRAGCRLQISHLQTVGRANWPRQEEAIAKIERAREKGIDVAFDSYPYVAGSTVMTQLLPQWTLDGGVDGMLQLLTDAGRRAEIAAETVDQMAQTWADIFVSAVRSAKNQALVGRNLAEIGVQRNRKPVDAMIDLLIEESGRVNMISFNQSQENLRKLISHPLCNVISDGFYVDGRPHPRLWGTFPLLLGPVCRDWHWLTLPEAVHKVTGKTAERFGMSNRGRIEPGYQADITVFDAQTVDGPATYEAPETPPLGICRVFKAGVQVAGAIAGSPAA